MAKVLEKREVADVFAEYVAETVYEDIPKETVEVTKRSILDTLGVAVAASGQVPEVKAVADLVKEAGGKEESTILGFGGKVPAWMAAFANGAMAHALDYDDVMDELGLHPSATTVPAALAIAERIGGVGGKELITAVTVGNDLIARLSRAVVWKRDWFMTPVFGVFAAAAACGKLLGFNREKLVDAFGVAFCQAAGTMEIVYGTGSNIRAIYDSFVGKAGVLSALLAERGISGVKASMEGKAGLLNIYFRGEYDPDLLTADLGKRFEGSGVAFKAWPCCRRAHPAITSALALVRERGISAEEIKAITVEVNTPSLQLCVPVEARQRPKTVLDAKFSIPYTVATAIIKGTITLEDFSPETIRNAKTLGLAQKVAHRFNAELDARRGMTPGRVEIETKDGKLYSRSDDFAYGHPRNPISREDLLRKFADCVACSAKPVRKDNVDGVIKMVSQLESVSDVREIVGLLA